MTLLYTHPDFLAHDTGPHHPERPQRLQGITRQLERTALDQRCTRPTWQPLEPGDLEPLHHADYVHYLARFAQRGGGHIEPDTVVARRSYDIARLAAGAPCDAVDRLLAGQDSTALCLVRPPGHHAVAEGAMGFCLFNNIALAAYRATRHHGLDRVLVVDWDVHHGNGTQALFWEDPRVGFLSIHRWPFYPGSGWSDETGSGPGLGYTLNLPIEMGTSRRDYLAQFTTELQRFADSLRPQLVLVSAGFDSHRDDPIGSLGLETEDFLPLTQAVLDVAQAHCGGRVVSVLEGGYNTGVLAGCVELHLRTLLEYPLGSLP